jgi:hypothetical protein
LVKKGLNKKWPEKLISEHLLAVNPCGLQTKKPDFHVTTVKSRSNQIGIFLFEGFNLAHSSSPSTFEVFGTRILAAKCSLSSNFGQQILVEQRKIEVLLKNPFIFQKKKSQKSGKSSEFLKYIFLLSWIVALQTCILKNLFWNNKILCSP